nr:hypothetical protein SHINE37_110264 [Rhizobiaceae bacterium]
MTSACGGERKRIRLGHIRWPGLHAVGLVTVSRPKLFSATANLSSRHQIITMEAARILVQTGAQQARALG